VSSSRIQSLPPDRRTEIDLLAWLGQADAGDVLEYHHGFLALDRSPCGAVFKERDRVAIGQVASQAMRLAEHGFVHLLQRRVCSQRFSYLAVARPRAGLAPIPISTLMSKEKA